MASVPDDATSASKPSASTASRSMCASDSLSSTMRRRFIVRTKYARMRESIGSAAPRRRRRAQRVEPVAALHHLRRDRRRELGMIVQHRLQRVLRDLDRHHVGQRDDVGGAALAGEQRHLAEDVSLAEARDLGVVDAHRDRAVVHDEHRVAGRAVADDRLPLRERVHARGRRRSPRSASGGSGERMSMRASRSAISAGSRLQARGGRLVRCTCVRIGNGIGIPLRRSAYQTALRMSASMRSRCE